MEATEELFTILENCIDWNDTYKNSIQNCINNGADLTSIYQKYMITPLMYAMKRRLHPECIKLLTTRGFNYNLKIKYSDYIYDNYVGIEYNVTQYKSIKNIILELYLSLIGEDKESHLVELFTERNYLMNIIHYPLDITDYLIDIDDIIEPPTPIVSFIESEIDNQYHNMSIYDIELNNYKEEIPIINNIKHLEYLKAYCEILNLDYNTISEWKLEVPDDFTKYR